MAHRISGGRLFGLTILALVQFGFAGLLGFIAYMTNDEAARYHRQTIEYPNYDDGGAASARAGSEAIGAVFGAIAAAVIGVSAVVSVLRLQTPASIVFVQRISIWTCFLAAFLFFFLAVSTPRSGSPHNDIGRGLNHYISAFAAVTAGFAAMGIGALAKSRPATSVPEVQQ